MDPEERRDVIRLTELRDKPIRTEDGEKLGRVHEVHCNEGRIVALMSGPGSLIERLTARTGGRKIPWECVTSITPDRVVVDLSASRSRRGTRRASGPRSRR